MPTIKIVPFPGKEGPQGERGPIGYQGDTGLTGPQGPAGAAGASAYEVAVANGYTGTEQQWLDSLQATFPTPTPWTPVMTSLNGDFTQSSNAATGTYMKYGLMVVCHIKVPFTNVTNFGSGQYSITLPFPVAHETDLYAGTLHDTDIQGFYTLKGHSDTPGGSTMTLWYQSITTKDAEFDMNSPITLTNADHFHMDFIYQTTA